MGVYIARTYIVFLMNKAYTTIFLFAFQIGPFYKNGHGKMEKLWAMFKDGSCYIRKSKSLDMILPMMTMH